LLLIIDGFGANLNLLLLIEMTSSCTDPAVFVVSNEDDNIKLNCADHYTV
jgi:hypothetical protein